MKLGVLFSGGKDSALAMAIAKQYHYKISCLISIFSKNPYSYMFHTPSIKQVKKQAEVLNTPIIFKKTKGKKEYELRALKRAIIEAIKKYSIQGVVTGAVESVYQATRVQKICNSLGIECFNPLWQRNQLEILKDIIKKKFEVIITSVAAYPLNNSWLGRKIDNRFLKEIEQLNKKFKISPSGEGGEFETFVLNCPLFKRKLKIIKKKILSYNNSYRMEITVK